MILEALPLPGVGCYRTIAVKLISNDCLLGYVDALHQTKQTYQMQ